jgi:hypothetical protein
MSDFVKAVEEVVVDKLERLGFDKRSGIVDYMVYRVVNLLIVAGNYNYKDAGKYINQILREVRDFYRDRHSFLNRRAREEYYNTRKLPIGRYMWRVVDDGSEYRVLFFTSLCSEPELYSELTLIMPKLNDSEIDTLMKLKI